MICSQFEVKTLLIMFKYQFSIFGVKIFLQILEMKIFISKFVVSNTPFWDPL